MSYIQCIIKRGIRDFICILAVNLCSIFQRYHSYGKPRRSSTHWRVCFCFICCLSSSVGTSAKDYVSSTNIVYWNSKQVLLFKCVFITENGFDMNNFFYCWIMHYTNYAVDLFSLLESFEWSLCLWWLLMNNLAQQLDDLFLGWRIFQLLNWILPSAHQLCFKLSKCPAFTFHTTFKI